MIDQDPSIRRITRRTFGRSLSGALLVPTGGIRLVGEVTTPAEPAPTEPTFTERFIKAAKDLHEAYLEITQGNTRDKYPSSIVDFLGDVLKRRGYSEEVLTAFSERYQNMAIWDNKCVQCVGFVGLALTLATGDRNTLTVEQGIVAARIVYSRREFRAGDQVFRPVGVGSGVIIQPGDIVVEDAWSPYYGHIYIVREVIANGSFTSYEANLDNSCWMSDNRVRTPAQIAASKFYRGQPIIS